MDKLLKQLYPIIMRKSNKNPIIIIIWFYTFQ